MPNRRNIRRQLPLRPKPLLSNRLPSISNDFPGQPTYTGGQSYKEEHYPSFAAAAGVSQPKIPVMNGLVFEAFFFFYLLAALCAQYLFIYKTVWWYPNTLPPSTMTVNFHLIDKSLTLFLVIVFCRRFLWTLMWNYARPAPESGFFLIFWALACLIILGFCIVEMGNYMYSLFDYKKSYKVLYLCYPILLWIPINMFTEGGSLRFIINYIRKKPLKTKSQVSIQKLTNQLETAADSNLLPPNVDAMQVQEEVKKLCHDFNSRLAEILFGSLMYSYYSGLVPIFFTPTHHSYDVAWSVQHAALILMNSFAMLSSYKLPPHYLQTLHNSAVLLGGYRLVSGESEANIFVNEDVQDWSPHTVYSRGTYVKFNDKLFVTLGKQNCAIPGNSTHSRFFFMFYKPLRILNWLLGLHFAVVIFQIHVIIWASQWDHIIAPAVLQFFSYYILFITLRDRIVIGKFYKLNRGFHNRVLLEPDTPSA